MLLPSPTPAAEGEPVVFQRDVLPILSNNCFSCHGFDASGREAGLRLDLRDGAIANLDSGAQAIVPEKPDASELIRRIESADESELMPPKKSGRSLTAQQREILRRWIAQGAAYQKHWAFERPIQRDPPSVDGAEHPLDRFLQQRLSAEGLKPSPKASLETLIRRVSLDLTGLPPTIAEIDAFLAESQADPAAAYRHLVERLLASPHYGERWGRWWLDQARYADSNGYSIDGPRQIWKFRDWVIDAFNKDLPFDQFTLEQLAGDLLPGATQEQKIATGFHRNTQINQEGGIDREQFRIDSVFDRVATTGSVWLGLTVGCAQCHDHKFDPITQKEYYQLFAFLNNQDEPTLKVYAAGVNVPELTRQLQAAEKELTAYFTEHAEQLAAWEQTLDEAAKKKLPNPVKTAQAVAPGKRSFAQKRTLFAASPHAKEERFTLLDGNYAKLDAQLNSVATTLVLQEAAKPRTTTVFIKGDFTRPADVVTPGTPSLLHPFENQTGQANRIDLARWLTSRTNPLTARVIVNRVWQQYFGRGIVETDNDFGAQGSPPSHPELLDWLAISFMEHDWRIKDLHRLIVSSHAYQQASVERADLRQKDPHNYLLGRQRRLRLDAEIIRDVALTASGLLAPKLGGPPVYPPIPDGVMGVGQVKHAWPVSTGADRYRRGCYTFAFRATPPPALNVFDAPDGYSSCTRRLRSNTPLQALTLLNDGACLEFAGALEAIIRSEGIEPAFRRCTSRRPSADELALLKTLDAPSAARVLLNLDETITRE